MRSDVGGPVVLLAIDDQPQSLELVSAALDHLDGLQILTETDPDQALEVVRKRRPHIVLVDLMMPKMSGMDVLERVIECDPGTEVILMTAHYSTESAVKAIQMGACDYLNKPIDIEKLTGRVAQVIANTRQRRR